MKIIKKIKALLSKTVENGATEAEAFSALNKANALLKEHHLSLSEVTSPYSDQEPLMHKIDLNEYALVSAEYIIAPLSKLFDCFFYKSQQGKNIKYVVYGYEQDVEFVTYFTEVISRSAKNSLEKFKNSADFKLSVLRGEKSQIMIADFEKAFVIRASNRIFDMYHERIKNQKTSGVSLAIINKRDDLRSMLEKQGYNFGQSKSKKMSITSNLARQAGYQSADSINISQGVSDKQKEGQLALS